VTGENVQSGGWGEIFDSDPDLLLLSVCRILSDLDIGDLYHLKRCTILKETVLFKNEAI
jgi:hypothetical protein